MARNLPFVCWTNPDRRRVLPPPPVWEYGADLFSIPLDDFYECRDGEEFGPFLPGLSDPGGTVVV